MAAPLNRHHPGELMLYQWRISNRDEAENMNAKEKAQVAKQRQMNRKVLFSLDDGSSFTEYTPRYTYMIAARKFMSDNGFMGAVYSAFSCLTSRSSGSFSMSLMESSLIILPFFTSCITGYSSGICLLYLMPMKSEYPPSMAGMAIR
jgi:hypothetical protein